MISDWNDLQTILAISEARSLSGAARALGLNQSTVSRRLKAIETALDRPVFGRDPEGRLHVEDAGRPLIEAALRIRDLIRQTNDDLGGQVPALRVASCEVLSRSHAAPLISAWREKTGQTGELAVYDTLFELPQESFDVMITPLESAPEDMIGRRIDTLTWHLYASDAYLAERPFAPGSRSLAGHDVIHPSGSLAEVAAYRWLLQFGGNVVFRSSSPLLQRDEAEAGLGIALLPHAIVSPASPLVRLDLGAEEPRTDIWIVARRGAASRPAISSFLRWSTNGKAGGKR
ncbi:LysR family transcriptional regulator [Pseudomonas sp. R2.Fl]|nr:LysR family transcriptional regulator [Pseudomonas sp. R2.Fl]